MMKEESKGLILAVDDNPEHLGLLSDYLDHFGFTVLPVQNGEDALKKAEDSIPDLILLDIVMPDLDGFEVWHRLKANNTTKNIPVIFITALSNTGYRVNGFEVEGVAYITKPFQPKEILDRVKSLLKFG
jgi:DNA-binding response OmpR family regulator